MGCFTQENDVGMDLKPLDVLSKNGGIHTHYTLEVCLTKRGREKLASQTEGEKTYFDF